MPATLPAQRGDISVSGRVLRGGRDTVPLGGAWVVLHYVTRDSGGPLDSVRTNARGRYRIPLRVVDTTGVYVVSAWYDSLAYFSLPLNVVGRPAVHVEDIVAYPTTVDSPPIRLARRLVTVARPGADGHREILEILELENTGVTTRITRDTLVPTWAGRVPVRIAEFRGGQGDISPEAVVYRNDSVHVLGPIPPGPVKQLSYGYLLARDATTLTIPIDQATVELNLLVEDTAAAVSAPGVEALGVEELEQRRFAAYRAGPLAPGDDVVIVLPRGPFRAQWVLPYVVALFVMVMVGALVWALRRKPSADSRQPSARADS
ncbi:MAG: hypothetical protein ACREME_13245 [Gemmatimonadales bacterium]